MDHSKHFKVTITYDNGIKYRNLVYINDNTVKYTKPFTHQPDSAFIAHALKMIGWL